MSKKLTWVALGALFLSFSAKAQFSFADLEFWVGQGSDSAMLVIDFQNGQFDSSYAWGYRYNPPATGGDMLSAIASADPNLSVNVSGGFLNDVLYISYAGIGGQPNFWSTWSGVDTASLAMNAGLSTPLVNGEWFALSYTDFNPARKPGTPIAAWQANLFQKQSIPHWLGQGQDSAMLVVDFQQGPQSSYAWGVLFNDSISGQDLLAAVDLADSLFQVQMSSFLNDITYNGLAGLGGAPNFWSTWTSSNFADWRLNAGISTYIKPNGIFACSYTDFNPPLRPRAAQVAPGILNQEEVRIPSAWQVYPNPSKGLLRFRGLRPGSEIELLDASGQVLRRKKVNAPSEEWQLSDLPAGYYQLRMGQESRMLILQP